MTATHQTPTAYRSLNEATLEYQEKNAVERYVLNGLNIWPYLRTATACRLEHKSGARREANQVVEAKNRLRRYSQSLLEDRSKNARARRGAGDVVFVTSTNRRRTSTECTGIRSSNPLAIEFEQRGVTTLICEAGPQWWPRARPSMWISRKFKLMRLLWRLAPKLLEPHWFQEYARWTRECLGRRSDWEHWEPHLREMFARARVFEKMFRKMGTKAVFLDCWYTWESFAATLAARRAGVLSIELQHGVQGLHMSGYAGWRESYELMPNLFWVWGQQASEALRQRNAFDIRTVVGGNCWLTLANNEWPNAFNHDMPARRLYGGGNRGCVVTLPLELTRNPSSIHRALPRDWQWLVRSHLRRGDDRYALSRRAEGIHPHVLIDEPSGLPGHPLIVQLTFHVTGAPPAPGKRSRWQADRGVMLTPARPSVLLEPTRDL